MNDDTKANLLFADALLRVWRIDLQLSGIVMEGHRDLAQAQSLDPFVAVSELDQALEEARQGIDTPATAKAKRQMVEAALHMWPRIHRHLEDKIYSAIRILAVSQGENPDMAVASIIPIIAGARNGGDLLAEKQKRLEAERAQKNQTREQAAHNRALAQLNREALQGL